MTLTIMVTRPEPGATTTQMRLRALDLPAIAAPLSAMRPLPWHVTEPDGFDALLLTSANALRHGGAQLSALRALPAWCVGAATAAAAEAAGLTVEQTGTSDAADLLRDAPAQRWLWLAGERHQPLTAPPGGSLLTVPVYAATPLEPPAAFADALAAGSTILMAYSRAAAERLAALVPQRGAHRLVAISRAVAAAAGDGWADVRVAPRPDDGEMVALAAALCQKAAHG